MRNFFITFIMLLIISNLAFAQDDDRTPYEIALERIAEAERTGITYLDLSDLDLEELPPEIGNLNTLHTLFAYDNNLTGLPSEIGNLNSLAGLYLNRNQFQILPPEIGNLINLQVLSLSQNQLSSLPPEIGNLRNLEILRMNSNQLSSLPSEIGNLTDLRALYLANNRFSSLTPEVGNLTNLCLLNLQDNQLNSLPLYLVRLEHLTNMSCISFIEVGLYTNDNPLVFPPQEVVDEGTKAILDFLGNPLVWYLRQYGLWIAGGIAMIALFILALRWRMMSVTRKFKEKVKRSE